MVRNNKNVTDERSGSKVNLPTSTTDHENKEGLLGEHTSGAENTSSKLQFIIFLKSGIHREIGAMKVIFLTVLLLFRIRITGSAQDEFLYNGFNYNKTYLQLDGIAEITKEGLLMMTNTTKNQKGHAFHTVPLHFKNKAQGNLYSFSTSFVFAIISEYPDVSTHGLALVFSPSREISGALPSQYLGLFNSSNNGNSSNHIMAVEFDTIYNIEFGDIDNNHVGIDVNGLRSIAAAPASYHAGSVGRFENLSLFSGEAIQAWVDYSGAHMKLNVTISPINVAKPSVPLLSSSVDLSSVFCDTMYIGFSSSSGSVVTSHYVYGWSFSMNGEAPVLNLSRLPALPQRDRPKKSRGHAIEFSLAALASVLVLLCGIGFMVRRRIKHKEVLEDWELEYRSHRFSYKDLYRATKGFKDEELLGVGGFGRVYKGKLPISDLEVAVKRIVHDSRQGMQEFVAEVASIGRLRHRNIVQLLGYCRRKGELLLVYEFMCNGSLDKFLFVHTPQPNKISWSRRFQIIKGVASGLSYLHAEWEQIVVHRDVKASNVLLDGEMNGKLGDFGLSRLHDRGSDPRTTHVVGTLGYIAPELARTGRATTCTDVFSFGVLLLEVSCGRTPIEQHDSLNLVEWVRRCWREGVILETRDPKLGSDFDVEELELVLKLGLLCSHPVPAARPSMHQVLQYLDRDVPLPEITIHGRDTVVASPVERLTYDHTTMSSSSYGTDSLLHGGKHG